MYQLRALIWQACKIRLRSPFSIALDVGGPLTIMIMYVCLRVYLGSVGPDLPLQQMGNYFTNPPGSPINARNDIERHMCKKVLYYSPKTPINQINDPLPKAIAEECGVELIFVDSPDILVNQLKFSLNQRKAYKGQNQDLNKSNATRGCLDIPGANESIYQTGLVYDGRNTIKIYLTDSAANRVIYQPYTQGSHYNEFRFPHSDLNSGQHILETCLASAYESANKLNANANDLNKLKWRLRAYPAVTSPYLLPILFMVFILAGNFCNAVATVLRITEANENGLHQYIRSAGVPAGVYWSAHMIMLLIHMAIQGLIIAILLAIPTGGDLFDPIYDMNMTIRWLLLLTYSLAINTHALFVGSVFEKSSHVLLMTCLLGCAYGMYPMSFVLQWNPYKFSTFPLADLVLLNPASNFQALLLAIYGVAYETNEPFTWTHMPKGILGGGHTDWSIGGLWALLIFQIILWFILTIMVDLLYYCSTYQPISFLMNVLNELCCCNNIGPKSYETSEEVRTKSKTGTAPKDPNRICLSLRHVYARGPTVMMANTRDDALKLSPEQLNQLKLAEKTTSKAQYLVNMSQVVRSPPSKSAHIQQPVILDEAILQHITWSKTRIFFENLTLDLRFNQVTFILGQTDLKDLFFSLLLGLRSIQSGGVIIDGTKYSPSTMQLARSQIGFLGERDVFLNEMSIYENLQFFGSLRDPSYTEYDSESLFVLNLLHLSSRRDNLPSCLTYRSARKMALAVAAVGHTKLLLLVEPTLSLRWKPRCQVLNLLKKYKSIRSIVVDTSDVDEAIAFGDRVLLLKNGQVDLDGTPDKLAAQLSCGYWMVFEPCHEKDSSTISPGHLDSLENLTNILFKSDKLEKLDLTKRSVYEELMSSSKSKVSHAVRTSRSPNVRTPSEKFDEHDRLHRTIVILKLRHTDHAVQGICYLLKMLQDQPLHGFRLAELTYESLEDVVVLRMSRAIFPDLPPDLLLSLQHRTRTGFDQNDDGLQISVRRCSSDFQVPKAPQPMYVAKMRAIIRDRIRNTSELAIVIAALVVSLIIMALTLYSMRNNINSLVDKTFQVYQSQEQESKEKSEDIKYTNLDSLFRRRVGLYLIDTNGTSEILSRWPGNKQLTGLVPRNMSETDVSYIISLMRKNKDLIAAMAIHDPSTQDMILIFDPHLVHSMTAGIKALVNFRLSSSSTEPNSTTSDLPKLQFKTLRYSFGQSWQEMIHGFYTRRFYYGLGFAIAEGIAIGVLVIAPIRHRSEVSKDMNDDRTIMFTRCSVQINLSLMLFRDTHLITISILFSLSPSYYLIPVSIRHVYRVSNHIFSCVYNDVYIILYNMNHKITNDWNLKARVMRVRTTYWLAMALFDLSLSTIQIFGYIVLFALIELTISPSLVACMILALVLYKISILPVAYMVSLVAQTSLNGFFFIVSVTFTITWVFAIHLKSFVEYSLLEVPYIFRVATWLVQIHPISSIVDTITNINHVSKTNLLCDEVPAYTATSNIYNLDGPQPLAIVDKLISRVHECLANGKSGISTSVIHVGDFGILWDIYLICLFGTIVWIFLLFSERVFGLFARRFGSSGRSIDPLKTMVRSPEPTNSIFKWDREKDRLISEFIRCINEYKYVRLMADHCVYLRIWLKPLSDQSAIDKHLALILEPLYSIGLSRGDISVELKTTLQIFIRIGTESNRCKVSKLQLLECYASFIKAHSDKVMKFAVVDWSRETLYKTLLHGHYNTKSTTIAA